jgi:methyl-accepting chemotaxis protein
MHDREMQIETMLAMGENLVKHYHGLQLNGTLTQDEAQKQAKAALTQLRYGGSYYWVRQPDGLNLVHPDTKKVGTISQGQTMDGRPDASAYREELAKSHIALVSMKSQRPDGSLAPKLNGLVEFTPWNWWIGTGFSAMILTKPIGNQRPHKRSFCDRADYSDRLRLAHHPLHQRHPWW